MFYLFRNKYLWIYGVYVQGTVLDAGETRVNKMDIVLLAEPTVLWRDMDCKTAGSAGTGIVQECSSPRGTTAILAVSFGCAPWWPGHFGEHRQGRTRLLGRTDGKRRQTVKAILTPFFSQERLYAKVPCRF